MMKKIVLFMCLAALISGCSPVSSKNFVSESAAEPIAETETEVPTETDTDSAVVKIADDITFYDLTFPQNSSYRKDKEEAVYVSEHEMPGYGKITAENGNIFLDSGTAEPIPLIELPVESETVYVTINCIIDNSRFAYMIHQEDGNLGSGIYDLSANKDHRIENKPRSGYCPVKASGDKLILTRGHIAEFHGYSVLDLNTYELTDLESPFIKDDRWNSCTGFSRDIMTAASMSAFYPAEDESECTVTLYSIEYGEVIREFTFNSENKYINFDLEFVSNDQLYIYALKDGDDEFNYLYVIELSP